MERLTFAHYVVLVHAVDEPCLWELLWGISIARASGAMEEVVPALSLDEVRPALESLVEVSAVEMFEESDDPASANAPALATEEALAAIADDANWIVPSESGRDTRYLVVTTDAGEELYKRAYELHGEKQEQ